MDKLKQLFLSLRFQQLAVVTVIQILVALDVISGDKGVQIANIVSVFLVGVAGIGTLDKTAQIRAGSTTVSMPSNVSSVTTTTKKKK